MEPRDYRTDGRRGGAPADQVAAAVGLLAAAKRPVILAGLGVVRSGCADQVAALAERLGAPVANVFMHNDAFPASHELGLGPIGYQGSKAAMKVVAQADCVLAPGTRLNRFGLNPQYGIDFWPKGVPLIQNSHDPLELGAPVPIAFGLLGDAAEVTGQLLAALGGHTLSGNGAAAKALVAKEKEAWALELAEMSQIDAPVMHPRRALWELSQAMPDEATVVLDIGNVSGTAGAYLNPGRAGQYVAPGSLGGIGVSYPTAMGVAMARPEAPVVCIIGDGSWSMTMQEVMTAVSETVPFVAVLMNNEVYGAERRNQYDFFDERYFWTALENPDFSKIAGEMGAMARRLTKPEEIAPALAEALASDRPVVLEVMIDGKVLSEPYRRDALKPPVRHLPLYQV